MHGTNTKILQVPSDSLTPDHHARCRLAPMCLPDQVWAMLVAAVGIVYDTDRDRAGVTGRGSRLWWRTGIRR
jgi:hypothetical protein